MTKGLKASVNSASKQVATTGYAECVPVARCGIAECVFEGTKVSGGGKGSYENKSQVSYSDKQTGSYGRATTTEKASAGDFHWKNGTTGTRNEYTQRSTVRVGDKSGYTEVHSEQRVRNVTYDRSSSSSKNCVNYNNGGYGYGYGSDY